MPRRKEHSDDSARITWAIREFVCDAGCRGWFSGVWHHHAPEDELFLVVQGYLVIRLRDGDLTLEPGELVIIPRGTEHLPVAAEEVPVVLIEPRTTVNTDNVRDSRTVAQEDWI